MKKVESYILGSWNPGSGDGKILHDASTGEALFSTASNGPSSEEVLAYARSKGASLRKMTFHERARCLKKLALYLLEQKERYYEVSYQTGATRVDSWIDIEGGIGNLFVYSSKGRRELPDQRFLPDGQTEHLSKGGTFLGHHILTPLHGVAVHINAFNFPVWGMLEKIAVNLLAGMPAVVKPATATSYLTEIVVRDIIKSNIFPEGAIQLITTPARDLVNFVSSQDVVTFTGSASTGMMLKGNENVIKNSVRFNLEADSLNCCILGPDAAPGTEDFNVFIKEVAKEMTIKAGQKCTAIRRTIVPRKFLADVQQSLSERLKKVSIGHPTSEGVRMGPLASLEQKQEVISKIEELRKSCELVFEGEKKALGASWDTGAFVSPTILSCEKPMSDQLVHEIEAFGPVTTLLPYDSPEEAASLARKGGGSLVGSVVSSDYEFTTDLILEAGSAHGRFVILNESCAKESTGHGSPMPQLVHGGPGRAGGGEEMGGIRGVKHYMQRTAVQGHPTALTKLLKVYQPGALQSEDRVHPFRKYFEELNVGDTLVTHKRTVTEGDIVNFANVSWDHFYAHTDDTSFDGTLFEKRVAHGYFIMSAAAGLFVDPGKGPVLANYGLDELRFIKPVYVGATIHVRLTVKEKINQEAREGEAPRGVVKWQVDVRDEEDESVALGTILTLVQKKDET